MHKLWRLMLPMTVLGLCLFFDFYKKSKNTHYAQAVAAHAANDCFGFMHIF